jgi:hypothetical protein
VEVRPIQTIREYFQPNKKARALEKDCIVAEKGAICPIFEGDMLPQKKDPKSWPFIDGHNMKAVNRHFFPYTGFTFAAPDHQSFLYI